MCDCAAKPIFASVDVLSGLLCESTALGALSASVLNWSPDAGVSWSAEQEGFTPPLSGVPSRRIRPIPLSATTSVVLAEGSRLLPLPILWRHDLLSHGQ
jgi:hypothetical protein